MVWLFNKQPTQLADEPTSSFHGLLKKWDYLEDDIEFLIIATVEYIVYLDNELDVEWETAGESGESDEDAEHDGEEEEEDHTDSLEFNKVLNRVASLETMPCDEIPLKMKMHFKRLIGEGLARGLAQDYKGAQNIFDAAAAYLLARSQETSRYWYLSASALMTSVFIVLACVFWLARAPLVATLGALPFWLSMSGFAGSVGALLSVIGRTGNQHFDSSAGRRLHYLEATSRIWAGAISGTLVGLAVHSQLFFTAISNGTNQHATMILAAMASGASERLASSILADLGSSRHTKEKEA